MAAVWVTGEIPELAHAHGNPSSFVMAKLN